MAYAYTITDPDDLRYAEVAGNNIELLVDSTAKTVQIIADDTLNGSRINDAGFDGGVSGQCLYSKLKEIWKNDADLIKFPFPMESITPEQFEFINGWKPAADASRKLIRTAGWAEKTALGATLRIYAGVVTLGSFNSPSADKAYYQQASAVAASDFSYFGPVNEAVQIYGDVTNGNFDYRTSPYFLKLFLREEAKTYSSSDNTAIGASTLTSLCYRFPLSNGTDLKVTHTDAEVAADLPYTGIDITYYAVDQDIDIGGVDYPFRIIIEGNNATPAEIYEKVQYQLRQTTDIDEGAGDVKGQTANGLLTFVGDTLVTSQGVFIQNLNTTYLNTVEFYDQNNVKRVYPFVSSGTITFNTNLVGDTNAKYWMFFTTNPAGNFGTSTAVIVQDKDAVDITGNVSGSASIPFTFAYEANAQGGRTPNTEAGVTVVAIGLSTAQYVSTTATITRTTGQNISLVSSLERNYVNA